MGEREGREEESGEEELEDDAEDDAELMEAAQWKLDGRWEGGVEGIEVGGGGGAVGIPVERTGITPGLESRSAREANAPASTARAARSLYLADLTGSSLP